VLLENQAKRLRRKKVALVIIMAAVVVPFGRYRYTFPYGYTHACLEMLGMSLCYDTSSTQTVKPVSVFFPNNRTATSF
jgi:hypothetical protein